MTDLIQQLGTLALASRLKRLGELLQRDVSQVYQDQKLDFHARWFPVAYLLSQFSDLPVTTVADKLGLTHPAVNQIAGQMSRRGLLTSRTDPDDERRRLLSLTSKGKKMVEKLRPLWIAVETCTSQVIEASGCNLLAGITAIEHELDRQSMYDRIRDNLGLDRGQSKPDNGNPGTKNKRHNKEREV
ncbi:MAG: MarR family transcriptional regulator [bacterium]